MEHHSPKEEDVEAAGDADAHEDVDETQAANLIITMEVPLCFATSMAKEHILPANVAPSPQCRTTCAANNQLTLITEGEQTTSSPHHPQDLA